MTTCSTFARSIRKRVEEGKTLDTIADELCCDVKFNRRKIIMVIKDFLGDNYLVEHAATLEYDTEKAALAKRRNPQQNITTPEECGSTVQMQEDELARAITALVQKYGFPAVVAMVKSINIKTQPESN